MRTDTGQRLKQSMLVLLCLVMLVPLLVYAYSGTFSRHRADDFCHSGDIYEHGFWQAQVVVYQNSSDRYSVEPLVGITEGLGRDSIRLLPAVAILLWLFATTRVIQALSQYLKMPLKLTGGFLLAEILVFFTLFESPNLFQSLYWRAGMLTYLMPVITGTFLADVLLRQLNRQQGERISPVIYLLVGLLAFYCAGFSETSAALQAGALFLALLLPAWRALRSRRNSKGLRLLGTALAATLLGMLVLFLSPAAHLRQSNFEPPPDFLTLIQLSLKFGFDFIVWDTLKVLPLPMLVSFVMAALFSVAAVNHERLSGKPVWRLAASGLIVLGVCLLLVICCVAPSVYVYRAGMEPRAAITARWVTVAAVLSLGCLAGAVLKERMQSVKGDRFSKFILLSTLFLLVAGFYPLRAAVQAAELIPDYRSRAQAWDQRDAAIRRDVANGIMDIEAVELDSIGKIGDLKEDPDLWVNVCAARFYGARTIRTYVP